MKFFKTLPILYLLLLGMGQPAQAEDASSEVQKIIEEHRKKWCHVDDNPEINIVPVTDRVKYDYSLGKAELSSFTIDTESPYDDGVITDVGGLMVGSIEVSDEIELDEVNYNGLFCFYYKTIDVKISISPTVYISNEYPKGSCMFDEIKKHENKHVIVDRKVVNKYARKVGNRIVELINDEMIVGPVKYKDTETAIIYLRQKVKQEIAYIAKQMYDERNRRQQLVDSLGEYQDVTDHCSER